MKEYMPSFQGKEQSCENEFIRHAPYWHLYTSGAESQIIFTDEKDFMTGMNILAWCTAKYPDINILTFELMNNHLHLILSGDRLQCLEFFTYFKNRLHLIYVRHKRHVSLSGFNGQILGIPDLKALRNEIAYVNRNGYIVNPQCTPYSYPWGAGAAFFNPFLAKIMRIPFNNLTIKARRSIVFSKDITLPENYMVFENIILPSSFCNIHDAEKMFRDAHHYFSLLSKNFESYSEIAKRLTDDMFMTDTEMYGAISAYCQKCYSQRSPHLLSPADKIAVARKMHYDYRASNKQIKGILKIEMAVVEELFPYVKQ